MINQLQPIMRSHPGMIPSATMVLLKGTKGKGRAQRTCSPYFDAHQFGDYRTFHAYFN